MKAGKKAPVHAGTGERMADAVTRGIGVREGGVSQGRVQRQRRRFDQAEQGVLGG